MIPDSVVLSAVPESGHQHPLLCGAHRTMVYGDLLGEGPGFPTFHPRGEHGNVIDASTLHRHIPAYRLEAFAAEQLAGPGYMLDVCIAIIVNRTRPVPERCSDES